jgi:hypothetical protein
VRERRSLWRKIVLTELHFTRDRITQEQEEEFALLSAVIQLGGSAKRSSVLDEIKRQGLIHISDALREPNRTKNEPRWKTNLSWTRDKLVKAGHMPNKRGVWEVTDQGLEHYRTLSEKVVTTKGFGLLTVEALDLAEKSAW